MAVLPFDLDEEERRRQEEEAAGGGQIAGEPTGGTPGGGDEGGSPNAGSSPQARGTSGWTDVNAYLDANKEQAVQTADKIAGRLGEEAGGIRSDIDTAGTKFKTRVDEGTTRLNEDLVNRASADPLAFAKNTSDVDLFKKMRDAQYAGPSQFQDADEYGSLLEKISQAEAKGRGVDTEAGREALLAGVMKNPTKGMVTLDNLLIGQNKDARARLTEGAKPFTELQAYLDQTGAGAGDYITAAKAATEGARTGTRTALDTTKGRLNTELDTKLADTRTKATTESEQARQKLQNYRDSGVDAMTDRDLEILGITRDQAKQLSLTGTTLKRAGEIPEGAVNNAPEGQINAWWVYGAPKYYDVDFDPTQFATMLSPDAQITRANAASAEDYARIAALEDLMGGESGLLSQADVGQAGTANTDLYDFRGNEAINSAKNLLSQKDRQLIASNMGRYGQDVSDADIAAYFNGLEGFMDNVARQRLRYHSSNPEANARGTAGIRALARLGFYDWKGDDTIGRDY